MAQIHSAAKAPDPTKHAKNVELLRSLENSHTVNGAICLDLAEALPRLFDANFLDSSLSYLERIRNWCLTLIIINILGRPSELSDYSPVVEELEAASTTGPTAARGADGFLSHVKLVLNCWKGQHINSPKRYPLMLARNPLDAKFCVVYWLSSWLSATGIKSGPILPNLIGRKEKQRVVRADKLVRVQDQQSMTQVWYEIEKGSTKTQRCNLTKEQVGNILHRMCEKAGYPDGSSYTFKKMAVQWAVRSSATVPQIKAAGRWKSGAWEQYAQGGFNDKQAWEQSGQDDPIRKIWVFRPALWDTTVPTATAGSSKKKPSKRKQKKPSKDAALA